MASPLQTIAEIKRAVDAGRIEARIHVQIETIAKKETREQKPYWELVVADAVSNLTLRAWSDSPNYKQCEALTAGGFLEISGEFTQSQNFGVESKRWTCRALNDSERDALLAGPPALREKQRTDFDFIAATVAAIADPRLGSLARAFLAEFGERFRRTAAARTYHHARRGGLVEHTAQMMRAAIAIAGVYPQLNRDLLIAGVLFHDAGKLWENHLPEDGFAMAFDERGELLGHIAIGIEIVNTLWRKIIASDEARSWSALLPASEDVRLHLLHLIASHHGEMEFGSPVFPKTPEAQALHYVDNLDAKMEMFATGYEKSSRKLAPRIFERVRPLPGNLVVPLPPFSAGPVTPV